MLRTKKRKKKGAAAAGDSLTALERVDGGEEQEPVQLGARSKKISSTGEPGNAVPTKRKLATSVRQELFKSRRLEEDGGKRVGIPRMGEQVVARAGVNKPSNSIRAKQLERKLLDNMVHDRLQVLQGQGKRRGKKREAEDAIIPERTPKEADRRIIHQLRDLYREDMKKKAGAKFLGKRGRGSSGAGGGGGEGNVPSVFELAPKSERKKQWQSERLSRKLIKRHAVLEPGEEEPVGAKRLKRWDNYPSRPAAKRRLEEEEEEEEAGGKRRRLAGLEDDDEDMRHLAEEMSDDDDGVTRIPMPLPDDEAMPLAAKKRGAAGALVPEPRLRPKLARPAERRGAKRARGGFEFHLDDEYLPSQAKVGRPTQGEKRRLAYSAKREAEGYESGFLKKKKH